MCHICIWLINVFVILYIGDSCFTFVVCVVEDGFLLIMSLYSKNRYIYLCHLLSFIKKFPCLVWNLYRKSPPSPITQLGCCIMQSFHTCNIT